MFNNLRNEVLKQAETDKQDKEYYIINGFCKSWAEEHKKFSDAGLKEYLTDLRYIQYKKGLIDEETARKFALDRMIKKVDKWQFEKLAKIDAVENAEPLEYCTITVEWTKSSTWGNNPHAETRTNSGLNYGTASGCGYDKESAAIAEALNQDYSVLHMLYSKEEKRLKNKNNISRRDFVGYGSGYGILPAFEGGVGVSSHRNIFEKSGYKFETVSSGKTFDVYKVAKEDHEESYTIQGKQITIDNDFRLNCLHEYINTEVRLINEYLSGNFALVRDRDFSDHNLRKIERLLTMEEN